MIAPFRLFALGLILTAPGIFGSAATPATGFPFGDETLDYTITWPSGLSLGEAHTTAKQSGGNWDFEMTIDASVPGYAVKDDYKSAASSNFCSTSFSRNTNHGGHSASDSETVQGASATNNGTAFAVPSCVKDALTLLYFTRRELGQGRVPPAQQFLFGKLYNVQFRYAGAATVTVGGKPVESDMVVCAVGASGYSFEIYFARDAARTPLLVKAGFALGTFSMELVR